MLRLSRQVWTQLAILAAVTVICALELARYGGRVNAIALWVAVELLSGVTASSTGDIILAGLVLGVANAIFKPILTILSIPLIIVTLGLGLFLVSMAMIGGLLGNLVLLPVMLRWLPDGFMAKAPVETQRLTPRSSVK